MINHVFLSGENRFFTLTGFTLLSPIDETFGGFEGSSSWSTPSISTSPATIRLRPALPL